MHPSLAVTDQTNHFNTTEIGKRVELSLLSKADTDILHLTVESTRETVLGARQEHGVRTKQSKKSAGDVSPTCTGSDNSKKFGNRWIIRRKWVVQVTKTCQEEGHDHVWELNCGSVYVCQSSQVRVHSECLRQMRTRFTYMNTEYRQMSGRRKFMLVVLYKTTWKSKWLQKQHQIWYITHTFIIQGVHTVPGHLQEFITGVI